MPVIKKLSSIPTLDSPSKDSPSNCSPSNCSTGLVSYYKHLLVVVAVGLLSGPIHLSHYFIDSARAQGTIEVPKDAESLFRSRLSKQGRVLNLRDTNIGDYDLRLLTLPMFSGVISLDLKNTKISDKGLVLVGKLRNLKVLNLSKTKISGSGLKYLTSHLIEIIYLSDTEIDDQAIGHLRILPLTKVDLRNTKVTPHGIKVLRARLPGLTVKQ